MEAEFSRRKILTPAQMRALNERSDLRGWLQLGSHFGAIGVAGVAHWAALGTWWVLLTGLALGVLINFTYAAQHELSHNTPFKTRGLNEFWGRVVGFIQLYPRDFDQIQHFAHHQYTSDWDRDGELVREPYTLTSYLMWLSGLSYWRSRIFGMIRRANGKIIEPYIRKEEEEKVIHESRVHMSLYMLIGIASIWAESMAVFWFWLLPMLLTKPIHQLQNTIEHLGLEHGGDILENTRSTRIGPVGRWLCWQMPYHTAHHIFPTVPFWKLRELNDLIEDKEGTVHRMGWIEFQVEVIRKLSQKDESQWPMNEVWIVPRDGGRGVRRLEA